MERLDDRRCAEVRIGRHDPVTHVVQRTAGVEVLESVAARQQAVQAAEQIVPGDDPNRELAAESEFARHVGHCVRTRARVHAAGVGGHLDAALDNGGQDAFHLGDEVGGVAALGVA